MKLFLIIFLNINIYANEKWISITSEEPKEERKLDINISQIKTVTNLITNVKVIQTLLDKRSDKKESNKDAEKKWYKIENLRP